MRQSSSLIVFLSLLCCFSVASVSAAPAHVHGVSSLEVAIDGQTLSIGMEAPLDDLLGFEHSPRTPAEQEKVRKMAETLRAADKLFLPTRAAGCTLGEVKLSSSAIAPSLLGEKGAEAAASDGHADLDAEFSFTCRKPEALESLRVALFGHFPGMKSVKLSLVGPRGQKGAKLDPASPEIRW